MGKVSTTQSIWRSGGGDATRQSYCGSGVMGAQFYVPATNAAGDNVQASATNTAPVILPAGSVLLSVVTVGDGGAAETFDMGYNLVDGSGFDVNGFVATGLADASDTIQAGSATAGVSMGQVNNSGVNGYLTAGGVLTAGFSGWVTYFVQDPLAGQQNV